MKVTEEMVDKAYGAYADAQAEGDVARKRVRAALEAVISDEFHKSRALAYMLRAVHDDLNDFKDISKLKDLQNVIQRALHAVDTQMSKDACTYTSRWDAFSDEELGEINAGASERADKLALPEDVRELRRRKGGYQGPGVYKVSSGRELEVLGRQGEDGAIVLRSVGDMSGLLYFETWNDFNYWNSYGTPAYRYLRPLGEN